MKMSKQEREQEQAVDNYMEAYEVYKNGLLAEGNSPFEAEMMADDMAMAEMRAERKAQINYNRYAQEQISKSNNPQATSAFYYD